MSIPIDESVLTRNYDKQKILLMALRQALIMMLGAIEDYLEVQRSIVPRRKR